VRLVFVSVFFFSISVFAATDTRAGKTFATALEDLLRSPEYQATQNEIRAIELDFASRDLALEPELEVSVERINENRERTSTVGTFKPRIDTVSATLSKPFSTGTELSFGPSWEKAQTPSLTPDHRDTVFWQFTLSQSLWQDGFGRSTRLRHSREDYERKQQLADALLRRAQLLADFETIYWDWALAVREEELQRKNLKRSEEILRWVQGRFNRAAAENVDLLQARALLSQRQLRVATVNQSLTLAIARMERYVPMRSWQPVPDDLMIARPLDTMVTDWHGDDLPQAMTLDSLSAVNGALAAAERAKETRESIRPELNLVASYGKNAIDTGVNDALRRSYEEEHEYSTIGVVFRTGLDIGRERKLVDSARAARDAAQQRGEARRAENRIAWEQLQKEVNELKVRIGVAKELHDLQERKANAERARYRQGRSTAFQAITFEQDAAEAELTLWTLHALMRKTEARARLFAR
jgi:outer membrane protein TolC